MKKESKEKRDVTPENDPSHEVSSEAETDAAEGVETPEPTSTSGEDVGALLKKLDEATAEISMQKERYLRTVADLENYRKRALREKEEARRQANCGLVEDLLPVLDNFKLGLKSAETHEGGVAFAEGFRMILTQMEGALKQNGLEEINPDQELFDPNFHEAVGHMPSGTVQDGHVVEVQRIGYKLHERLLRPAAVVISNGAPETDREEQTD
jgi:molecular chaperone GrpE